jgi:hypothetical protein
MSTRVNSSSPAPSSNASFRTIVLPREHGSWSLALEPVALGLAVAPSFSGSWLAVAVVAGFFSRRPLKLVATLAAREPRRTPAASWLAGFAALAVATLVVSAGTSGRGPAALWPLLLSVPFGAAFLWFDLRNEMREAEAEFAGSIAFALVPAAFATLAGWSAAAALGLAALMLTRSVPTVLTVRTYLRIAKGKPARAWVAVLLAIASFAVIAALAAFHVVPVLACAFVGLLVLRTVFVLSPFPPSWSARRVGMTEAILGLVFLAGVALAYRTQ